MVWILTGAIMFMPCSKRLQVRSPFIEACTVSATVTHVAIHTQ